MGRHHQWQAAPFISQPTHSHTQRTSRYGSPLPPAPRPPAPPSSAPPLGPAPCWLVPVAPWRPCSSACSEPRSASCSTMHTLGGTRHAPMKDTMCGWCRRLSSCGARRRCRRAWGVRARCVCARGARARGAHDPGRNQLCCARPWGAVPYQPSRLWQCDSGSTQPGPGHAPAPPASGCPSTARCSCCRQRPSAAPPSPPPAPGPPPPPPPALRTLLRLRRLVP